MEINTIPEAFQTKLRIAVISGLLSGKKTFRELKDITGATDGNLGAQLSKLESLGYLSVSKEFVMRKPQTTYELTELGIAYFKEYVAMLEKLLRNSHL